MKREPNLLKGLVLNLPDALLRQANDLSDLFKRERWVASGWASHGPRNNVANR